VHYAGTNRWKATFVPVNPLKGNLELHATLLAGALESNIRGGENKGKELHHEFAALELVTIGMASNNGVAHGRFILDIPGNGQNKNLALAVWVTRPGELTPLQAVGGWLPALDDSKK